MDQLGQAKRAQMIGAENGQTEALWAALEALADSGETVREEPWCRAYAAEYGGRLIHGMAPLPALAHIDQTDGRCGPVMRHGIEIRLHGEPSYPYRATGAWSARRASVPPGTSW